MFSLREALTGDWVSIVDRFNLPRKRINELKEQGVPAMEIISRTLKEMGIDYGLVAAQGQTAAAQFDQVKDRVQMLAGTLAEPLFASMSAELDKVNGYLNDHQEAINAVAKQWGIDFMNGISTAVQAIQDWLQWMQPMLDYIAQNEEAMAFWG